MKNECSIVQDLLPLYLEGMVSEETAVFVREHLEHCEVCRTEYVAMKNSEKTEAELVEEQDLRVRSALPITRIKKKLHKKKILTIILTVLLTIIIVGTASALRSATIDYGSSEKYSQQDREAAVKMIEDEFYSWDGCKLYSISFTSDARCEAELEYCNELADEGEVFTECIVFQTHFRSPIFGGGAWNANFDYLWTWYLAREDGGSWKLLTWGMP